VGLLQNLILEARSSYLGAQQAQLALSPKPRAFGCASACSASAGPLGKSR
jgi:hypothetical protein